MAQKKYTKEHMEVIILAAQVGRYSFVGSIDIIRKGRLTKIKVDRQYFLSLDPDGCRQVSGDESLS